MARTWNGKVMIPAASAAPVHEKMKRMPKVSRRKCPQRRACAERDEEEIADDDGRQDERRENDPVEKHAAGKADARQKECGRRRERKGASNSHERDPERQGQRRDLALAECKQGDQFREKPYLSNTAFAAFVLR